MPLTAEAKTAMFNTLKECLEKCCPPMVITKNSDTGIELIGNKPVPYGFKKEIVPGMYFASAILRKDVVSFYGCYFKKGGGYLEGIFHFFGYLNFFSLSQINHFHSGIFTFIKCKICICHIAISFKIINSVSI